MSEDFVNFTQRAVFSQTWNKWNFDLDSGYALPYGGNRRGYRGTWDTNLAFGYRLLAWLQPELEFNYAHDYRKSLPDSDLFALTAGVVMPLHERLRINAGAQQDLAGSQNDQRTTAKLVATLFL